MFEKVDAAPMLAVKDLQAARRFYEGKLGMTPDGETGDEVASYRSGRTRIHVYRSEHAGSNRATALTWTVGDGIDGVVKELAGKGVRFEHYEMPGMQRQGDLHVGGGMKVAWFKDPDGNILSVADH